MSQPRVKVSVYVSLDGILCIAEPFVTKPSMVRHHYKPERHMQKIGFYLQDQGHSKVKVLNFSDCLPGQYL